MFRCVEAVISAAHLLDLRALVDNTIWIVVMGEKTVLGCSLVGNSLETWLLTVYFMRCHLELAETILCSNCCLRRSISSVGAASLRNHVRIHNCHRTVPPTYITDVTHKFCDVARVNMRQICSLQQYWHCRWMIESGMLLVKNQWMAMTMEPTTRPGMKKLNVPAVMEEAYTEENLRTTPPAMLQRRTSGQV